jgi:hypothetical protein
MSLTPEDKKKLTLLIKTVLKDHATMSWGFTNNMGTVRQADALVVNVESKIALSALLIKVQALNETKKPEERIILRVAAGGRTDTEGSACYSATQASNADIVVRLVGPEFTRVIPQREENVVRAGASLQIGELDKILLDKHRLVLPTSSLIPYVTVGGLLNHGGHGTGQNQPAFSGLVTGLTLMLENGKEIRLERGDKDFETQIGALNGLFGIVTDVDIRCMPAQKLQCVMEKRSALEFIEAVDKGLFQKYPYVSVMYMPTYLKDEGKTRLENHVIIYRWEPVPLDTPNTNHHQTLSEFGQDLQIGLSAKINIGEILRRFPSLIPFYMRHLTAPLAIGKRDELSVGPWNEMMHYRTSFPKDLDEICGIFAVEDQPADATSGHGKEIIKALQHAIALLEECATRGEYPITYGLYFRYLQGSNGGLSCTPYPAGHHVCAMDLTTNINIPGFAAFKQAMQTFFLDEMKAKFHWGKNAPMDLDYQKMYGERWDETKQALERLHATHGISTEKSILLNPLFSHVLHYPLPSLEDVVEVKASTSAAKKHITAINAKKLVEAINVDTPVSDTVKQEIEKDILKQAKKIHGQFPAPTTEALPASRNEKPGRCVIL